MAAWFLRFLLNRHGLAALVEVHDSIGGGICDPVGENCSAIDLVESAQLRAQAGAVEDIVAEDERNGIIADVVRADDERFGKAAGLVLGGKGEVETPLRAVAK